MKSFLCIPFLALNAICMLQAQAATCSPDKIQEIVEPGTPQNSSVLIDCSLTLPKGASISKQLLFKGQQSSNTVLDCNAAEVHSDFNNLTLLITSAFRKGAWDVPENIQIKNCTINGAIRIQGMKDKGKNGLKDSSYQEGHTERAQQAAPHHIILDNLRVNGSSNIMYFAPGVHYVTFKNSRMTGNTWAVPLYLDAETSNNTIENNTFDVQTTVREIIAIDGSANNLIKGNTFVQPNRGGIYLYRNCGEGGIIRHQTPSNNQIISNRFELKPENNSPIIWIASRNGNRKYCNLDKGYALGSSANNNDLAENNTVADNTFVQKKAAKSFLRMMTKSSSSSSADDSNNLVRVDAEPNQVMRNKVTD